MTQFLDYADLFSVTLRDDNIQAFDTRWDEVSLSISRIPSDDILDSLYKLRIRQSDQLKNRIGIVRHGDSSEDISSQLSKDENHGEEKLRLRNFDARHGRIESGAVIKSRKGQSGVEGGKGICYQWKEKGQCSQGDRCSFRHETNDRAQKPEHTAATLSEPTASRGRSVSRKRGKSNHGSILRQPCRYYLKVPARERLVNIGIRPSANSFKIKRVVRLETSVCFRITRCQKHFQAQRKRQGYVPLALRGMGIAGCVNKRA